MAKVQDARDLIEEKLHELLYVERTLAEEVLPKLQEEVSSGELKKGLITHLEQTHGHISNLERCCQMLGIEPKASKSQALDGLKSEHDKGVKDMTSPDLVDLFDAGAAAATEHFEIAAYNSLIEMMDAMGQGQATSLLRENLEQEQMALREIEQVSQRLTRELVTV